MRMYRANKLYESHFRPGKHKKQLSFSMKALVGKCICYNPNLCSKGQFSTSQVNVRVQFGCWFGQIGRFKGEHWWRKKIYIQIKHKFLMTPVYVIFHKDPPFNRYLGFQRREPLMVLVCQSLSHSVRHTLADMSSVKPRTVLYCPVSSCMVLYGLL